MEKSNLEFEIAHPGSQSFDDVACPEKNFSQGRQGQEWKGFKGNGCRTSILENHVDASHIMDGKGLFPKDAGLGCDR